MYTTNTASPKFVAGFDFTQTHPLVFIAVAMDAFVERKSFAKPTYIIVEVIAFIVPNTMSLVCV
jgi:hypothetical protein